MYTYKMKTKTKLLSSIFLFFSILPLTSCRAILSWLDKPSNFNFKNDAAFIYKTIDSSRIFCTTKTLARTVSLDDYEFEGDEMITYHFIYDRETENTFIQDENENVVTSISTLNSILTILNKKPATFYDSDILAVKNTYYFVSTQVEDYTTLCYFTGERLTFATAMKKPIEKIKILENFPNQL